MPLDHPSANAALGVLRRTADAVSDALRTNTDWGLSGLRNGQYVADLVVDAVALRVLRSAGYGVLSEESGLEERGNLLVVLDPLDGSTNASLGITWYATSLCVLDDEGPWVSLVRNQATGREYHAIRGVGAFRDGKPIRRSAGAAAIGDAIVALSGYPPEHLGWRQFRTLGAAALDLCLVADGGLDAFIDCSRDAHGVWDYCGALLICREAGVALADAFSRELVIRDHDARRTPVAAASPELHASLLAMRATW